MHSVYLRNILLLSLEFLFGNCWVIVVMMMFLSLFQRGFVLYTLNLPTNNSHKALCLLWTGSPGNRPRSFLRRFPTDPYFKYSSTENTRCRIVYFTRNMLLQHWMFDLQIHCQKQANAMMIGRSLITGFWRYTHAAHASFAALREGFNSRGFCSPRSPDFTPRDFYLWGKLKKMKRVKQIPRFFIKQETVSITRSQQFPGKNSRELTWSAGILRAFGQEGNIFQRLL